MSQTAIERLNGLREEIKQKREAINKECKAVFEAEAKTIFERHPKLDSFKWRQYTPYFNDGEECIFGRHDADIGFAGKEY